MVHCVVSLQHIAEYCTEYLLIVTSVLSIYALTACVCVNIGLHWWDSVCCRFRQYSDLH